MNTNIGHWTEADLRRFVVNLLSSDPGALPKTIGGSAQQLPTPVNDGEIPVWDSAKGAWVGSNTKPENPNQLAGYPNNIAKVLTGVGSWLGGMTAIFDSTLGGSAANIDTGANGIPQTYDHLICMYNARSDRAVTIEDAYIQINNLSGATDYRWEQLGVTTTVPASTESIGTTTGLVGSLAAASNTANAFGSGVIFLPYYRSAAFKQYMSLGGAAGGTTGGMNGFRVVSGACATTGAISRIKFAPSVGPNLIAGSRFTIYGLGV